MAAPKYYGNLVGAGLPWFDVTYFGAKCDGATDDTVAIQATINAAGATDGGIVYIPGGSLVSSTLQNPYSRVRIVGAGSDFNFSWVSPLVPKSYLKWVGAAGGTLLSFAPAGSTSTQPQRQGLVDIALLSSNGLCGTGLSILSSSWGEVTRCFFDNFSVNGLYAGCVTALADIRDSQHWAVRDTAFFNVNQVQWTGNAGNNVTLDGTYVTGTAPYFQTASDASFWYFENCNFEFFNGNGILCLITDDNAFVNVTGQATGTGKFIVFSQNSSGNHFYHLSSTAGILVQPGSKDNTITAYSVGDNGNPFPTFSPAPLTFTPTTIAAAITQNSAAQTVTPASMTGITAGGYVRINNGQADQEDVVVITAGGSSFTAIVLRNHPVNTTLGPTPAGLLTQLYDNGIATGYSLVNAVLAEGYADALAQREAIAATTTLVVSNGAQDHMHITDGTNTYRIAINGSGALVIQVIAGTDSLVQLQSGVGVQYGIGGPIDNGGAGVPISNVPKGSTWRRTDGGVGSTLYVSQGGGTWNAVAGV